VRKPNSIIVLLFTYYLFKKFKTNGSHLYFICIKKKQSLIPSAAVVVVISMGSASQYDSRRHSNMARTRPIFFSYRLFGRFPFNGHDRSDPNSFLCTNGKIWSMFLKYLAKMDLIIMLSKFSAQIGLKPNVLCFIQKFDRSDRSGRVNGKGL
jgi:hypothetical protein